MEVSVPFKFHKQNIGFCTTTVLSEEDF